ncbi:hypothetical protein [Microtetraspora sp. NBRC 13810]|uniref:hypothetical protein n=1 Tax=Microtetraspora sp. NBRC 13810 TaxID=3030990 RepID=UPI002556BBD1|nr:hypothetical protein [Microtetraspora sp. NBRC 13810]
MEPVEPEPVESVEPVEPEPEEPGELVARGESAPWRTGTVASPGARGRVPSEGVGPVGWWPGSVPEGGHTGTSSTSRCRTGRVRPASAISPPGPSRTSGEGRSAEASLGWFQEAVSCGSLHHAASATASRGPASPGPDAPGVQPGVSFGSEALGVQPGISCTPDAPGVSLGSVAPGVQPGVSLGSGEVGVQPGVSWRSDAFGVQPGVAGRGEPGGQVGVSTGSPVAAGQVAWPEVSEAVGTGMPAAAAV